MDHLHQVLANDELARRTPRPGDPEMERRALVELARTLERDPQSFLQRLAETTVEICPAAEAAGVSLLRRRGGEEVFEWLAYAGRWSPQLKLGHPIPRYASPCGRVMERDEALLLRHPGRSFGWLAPIDPPVVEALLLPLHQGERPVGALWAATDLEDVGFDEADRRILSELSALAGLGHRLQSADAHLEDMRRLQEVSTRLIPEGDEETLLEEILDAAVEIMGAPMGNMQLLDPETGELGLHSQRGFSARFVEHFRRVRATSRTACGAALDQCRRVVEPDVAGGALYEGPEQEATLEAGVKALQSTPLVSRSGKVLGMLTTHWDEHHEPSPERLRLLDLLARQGADLVERARNEEVLRREEERYRTLFDSIDEGFCIVEMRFGEGGGAEDFRFLELNPAFTKLTGLEDPVGRWARELVPDAEEHWFETFGRVAATGEAVRVCHPLEALSGWFDVYAFRIGDPRERRVAILFSDITERKRAEEERERLLREVQAERELMEDVFHYAPSFMAILRGPDHVFERANELHRELVGDRELLGRSVRDVFPELEGQGQFERLDHVYQTGEAYVGNDVAVRLGPDDGEPEERWLNFVYQPLREPDGSVTGIFLQGVDLTERKRIEERLRRSEEKLKKVNAELERRVADRTAELERQAEQLRRLAGQLTTAEQRERRELAHTLHDHLQQLLAAARMKVDMAAARTEDPEAVERLREASEHLDQSIGETRTLATELSPPALYREGLVPTVQWLAGRMEEQHGLEVDVRHNGVPGTLSDDLRAFLFQAVRELVFNAVKHAETDRVWLDLQGASSDGWFQVTVTDEGNGVDPQAVLDNAGGGFGLLSIRERLHGFGGEFDLRNAEGGGCRVILRVPVRQEATEGGHRGEPSGTGAPLGGSPAPPTDADRAVVEDGEKPVRVLLVDDHKIIREGLVRLLRDEPGIAVVGEAADGQQGVEAVRELHPDVVVMDVSMPRLDGVDATRVLKRHWPEIAVIGLSMNADGSTATMMREAGADVHLAKGGPAEDLVAAIQEASERSGRVIR